MTIHLLNGDIVEMPKANQLVENTDGCDFYTDKYKTNWVGTLTSAGNFIDVSGSGNIIKKKGSNNIAQGDFGVKEAIRRIEKKGDFTWQENGDMLRLKLLLSHKYLAKQGRYK